MFRRCLFKCWRRRGWFFFWQCSFLLMLELVSIFLFVIVSRPSNWIPTLDPNEVAINQSVFFVETRTKELLPRNWPGKFGCALESIGLHNPSAPIYVLLDHQVELDSFTPDLRANFANLRFRRVNYKAFIRKHGGKELIDNQELFGTRLFKFNLSDLMRVLLLHAFGGYYLDMDYILIRPMPNDINFFGSQFNGRVNGAFMKFKQGHPFLRLLIQEFVKNFDGDKWGHNGPKRQSKVLDKFCRAQDCSDIVITPPAFANPFFGSNMVALYTRLHNPNSTNLAPFFFKSIQNTTGIHYGNAPTTNRWDILYFRSSAM
eukprot:maker-scaffold355_size198070-snap-gene-0.35 protein:Tk03307 transcript:maker-scaffold355_size198070-snap-gene-0.35-mRNA-1 annotation:"GJ17465"